MNDQLRKLGIIIMCVSMCVYVYLPFGLSLCDSQGKSIDTLVSRSKNGLMCEKRILR